MTILGVTRGTMTSLVLMVTVMGVMARVVEGQADLLASVIEFSDYPDDDAELMRKLDNGVPINVIQRPVTGAENIWKECIYKIFQTSYRC